MREKTIAVTVLWLSIKCYLSMYLALRDDIPRRSDLARSGSPQSIAYESCMSLFKENLLYVSNLITIFYYHHFGQWTLIFTVVWEGRGQAGSWACLEPVLWETCGDSAQTAPADDQPACWWNPYIKNWTIQNFDREGRGVIIENDNTQSALSRLSFCWPFLAHIKGGWEGDVS